MQPNISRIASLIGDPARASMLMALMSGKALTATELALEAGVTPQTASSHLTKLTCENILMVRKQGRHKYFQLCGHEVAELLEALLNISAKTDCSEIVTGPRDTRLRYARVCYDHLAGSIGVSLYNSLLDSGFIAEDNNISVLTPSGKAYFNGLGVNFKQLEKSKSKRPICKACLDWSERKNHLGGVLGKWCLDDALTKKWATRESDSRAITFTDMGLSRFRKRYKIT